MLPARTRSYALAPAAPGRAAVLRFLPYIARFKWQFIASFVMAPLGVLISVAIPLLLGAIVDGPIAQRNLTALLWFCLALLGLGVADAGLSFIRRWIMSRATSHIEADIRLDLFDKLQRLQMGFHKSWESGQLLSRMMSDLGLLRRFMSFGLVMLFMNSIHIVVVVVIMVVKLWHVGLAVLIAVIPVVIATFVLMGRFGKLSRRVQDETGDVASSAEESLHGVRVIRSFGRARYAYRGYDERATKLAGSGVARMNLASILWTLLEVFPNVLLLVVLIGVSFGVSRTLIPLISDGVLSGSRPVPSVVLVALNNEDDRPASTRVAAALRSRGIACERLSEPCSVTTMSSSMRTPMPRSSSGTSRSFSLKYSPGSIVKTIPGSSSASRYISRRACAQSWTSMPRWWLVPCGIQRRCHWPSGDSDSSAVPGSRPHSARVRASTSIAAACSSRKRSPGRATAKAASAASSTAS